MSSKHPVVAVTGSSGALRLYADYIQRRDPEALVLRRPAKVTDFSYRQSQSGSFQRGLGVRWIKQMLI